MSVSRVFLRKTEPKLQVVFAKQKLMKSKNQFSGWGK